MKESKRSFTLIELLVVVAIIGILSSILMPSLSKAREASKAAVCKSNMKQLGIALQMYGEGTDVIVPGGMNFDMIPPKYNYPAQDKTAYYSDPPMLGQYAGNDVTTNNVWNHIQGRQPRRDSAFICPSATDEVTFGNPPYNTRIAINLRISAYVNDPSKWANILKFGQILDPAKVALFVDHKGARFHPGYGQVPPTYGNNQPLPAADGNWSFGVESSNYNWVKRHQEGTNVGFIDGHVELRRKFREEVQDGSYKVTNY
ncbi:MAG: DUF1559 domain-containing protein [Lentisphaeraceae bacterium]|nr:DUF1559 domain-containing protein [Lentisphaeraceae bacterium]